MTRKDYIVIAGALRLASRECWPHAKFQRNRKQAENKVREGIMFAAQYLVDALQADNPRFNREHFLAVVKEERELTSRPPR